MVKATKMSYFERAKEAQSAAAGLRARVVEAGVPEDHVDSMVNRWVKAAEACDGKQGAEMEECYKKAAECPFKGKENSAWKDVDWDMVKAIKMGYFERAKKAQSAEEVRPLAEGLRARLVKAAVPEDHVDLFLKKWTESAEACDGKEGAEKEECYKTAAEWHHHHVAESDEVQPAADVKSLRLKRLFSTMYQTLASLSQKFGDLLKHVFG
jgi:hypothetical protein